MAEKFILTEEQRKIMNENGLDRINVWNRVKKLGWSIEKAITVPVRKANNEEGIKVIVDFENAYQNFLESKKDKSHLIKYPQYVKPSKYYDYLLSKVKWA
ncbi:hypothetical protein JSO97_000356 [Staphylococcus pseudintermedius]|nr:hypothetical protein [Staphylococcus pseudintermedius]